MTLLLFYFGLRDGQLYPAPSIRPTASPESSTRPVARDS